jgi:hypothetical protein
VKRDRVAPGGVILTSVNIDLLARHFKSETTPLLRTDFSDDAAWERVAAEVTKAGNFGDEDPDTDPDGGDGYIPNVEPVADPNFDGAPAETIAAQWDRDREPAGYVLLADAQSIREVASGADPTVVYLDLSVTEEDEAEFGDEYGRSFRCVVGEISSIESNLSIANMDFTEFADYADSHGGVFRGFED